MTRKKQVEQKCSIPVVMGLKLDWLPDTVVLNFQIETSKSEDSNWSRRGYRKLHHKGNGYFIQSLKILSQKKSLFLFCFKKSVKKTRGSSANYIIQENISFVNRHCYGRKMFLLWVENAKRKKETIKMICRWVTLRYWPWCG